MIQVVPAITGLIDRLEKQAWSCAAVARTTGAWCMLKSQESPEVLKRLDVPLADAKETHRPPDRKGAAEPVATPGEGGRRPHVAAESPFFFPR